jgi:hypothetical protein
MILPCPGTWWSQHAAAAALIGAALPLAAAPLISISEIEYNPPGGSDYEFLELVNLSAASLNIGGYKLTTGVTYTFAAGTVVPAGGRIVVCNTRSTFIARYGTSGMLLASGSYSGKLSDSGDTLTLVDSLGSLVFKCTYDSSGAWPSRANGLGSSLECIDPAGNLNDPANWRSSTEYNGSPGRAGLGAQKTVVINEVLTHTDPPIEDAIELYNLTDNAIDLGGWYLSNTRATPKKFRFPASTLIPAHGFRVFYELSGTGSPLGFNSRGTGADPEFTFNSAHGDEAVIVSADAAGNLLNWIDAVSFDSAEHGVSFGRYPDFTGPIMAMDRLTLGTTVDATYPASFLFQFRTGTGASNSLPRVGPLVFNRIQYHPLAGRDEFVELVNIASTNLPLYDVRFPENTWRIRNAVDFDFPTGVVLKPDEKCLVTPLPPAAFRTKYSIPPSIQVFGPWTNLLNNAGDTLELFKPDTPQEPPHPDAGYVPYIRVEKIAYAASAPWPADADGTGPALQRINPRLYGNVATNWTVETFTTTPPVITAALDGSSGIRIGFATEAGRGYVIETLSDLGSGPAWTVYRVLDPAPAASSAQVTVPWSGTRLFVRVR